MRKHLHITFFCFLFLSFSANSQYQNILGDYNLKGKVKSIAASEWLIRNNSPVKRTTGFGLMNKVTTLNEKGQVVSSFNIDSTAGKKGYTMTYDENGKVLTYTTYGHHAGTVKYEYEQPQHDKRITYSVNSKKQRSKVREEILNNNGQALERTDYTVENSNWTDGKSEEESTKHDSLVNKTVYRYNENGKLLEESDYNNDTLNFHEALTYDAYGHLTGTTTHWHYGRKETCSWNWQNNIKTQGIKMTYTGDKKEKTTMYYYDREGHVIREMESNHTVNTSRATLYEYVFDQNGNWTQRKMYWIINGKKTLAFTVDRVITYFE